MKTIQLSDYIFTDVADGDLFIYKYDDHHSAIKEMRNNVVPSIDEFTVEILSFYSKRHFIFKRDNGYYWWEETSY